MNRISLLQRTFEEPYLKPQNLQVGVKCLTSILSQQTRNDWKMLWRTRIVSIQTGIPNLSQSHWCKHYQPGLILLRMDKHREDPLSMKRKKCLLWARDRDPSGAILDAFCIGCCCKQINLWEPSSYEYCVKDSRVQLPMVIQEEIFAEVICHGILIIREERNCNGYLVGYAPMPEF